MPGRRGDWTDLSRATRRRWTARFGGRGDRAIRERRAKAAYEAGATIHRAEAGHERPEDRPSIVALVELPGGDVGYVRFYGLSRRERSRIGRHDSLIGQLATGRLSPSTFRTRVSRWAPVGGISLASDPAAALAAVERRRAVGEPLGPYPQGRAS